MLGELWAGFSAGHDREQNERELATFIGNSVVEELPIDRHVARTYGAIASELRASGNPLPTNDVWIAAASVRAGAPLLTFDRHFQQITRVGTILLQPEPGEN